MNLAKAAGVAAPAITGTKAKGSIVKNLISATSTSSSSEKKSSDDSTSTKSPETKSEAILRLMYSNPGATAQKAVADGTKEIVDWYAQKNRVSQAEAMGYQGKQQAAAMIGGAFSAAGQGLAQLFGRKKGNGEGGGGGGSGGGRRSSGGGGEEGGAGGGGGCANGRCNVASNDSMNSLDTNQAIKNATGPKDLDSSLNQPDQQIAMRSQTDAAVEAQQAQATTPPPPPPEPLADAGIMQA